MHYQRNEKINNAKTVTLLLFRKIMHKSMKNDKLKGLINIDNNRHEVDLKIL